LELRDLVPSRPRLARQVRWNLPVAVGSKVVVADAALVADGWVVLSVSPPRIREDAVELLDQIKTLVARR
jgi:hypothetical protein